MSELEIKYMLRHVFDKHVFMPGYSNIISRLAHLYAADKDSYRNAVHLLHTIDGNAYVAI